MPVFSYKIGLFIYHAVVDSYGELGMQNKHRVVHGLFLLSSETWKYCLTSGMKTIPERCLKPCLCPWLWVREGQGLMKSRVSTLRQPYKMLDVSILNDPSEQIPSRNAPCPPISPNPPLHSKSAVFLLKSPSSVWVHSVWMQKRKIRWVVESIENLKERASRVIEILRNKLELCVCVCVCEAWRVCYLVSLRFESFYWPLFIQHKVVTWLYAEETGKQSKFHLWSLLFWFMIFSLENIIAWIFRSGAQSCFWTLRLTNWAI